MCGICGVVAFSGNALTLDDAARLTGLLRHRGPDRQGLWRDPDGMAVLGHRRLTVIDPHPRSDQPVVSRDGRFALVFNGEIYNYRELRGALETAGRRFVTTSDTEVLLEALMAWGVPAALSRLQGMYAFALWDRSAQRLQLARDRFGLKPLYWCWQDGRLVFGSEMKVLMEAPGFRFSLAGEAITHLLDFGYIPSPMTALREAHKLEPGHVLTLGPGGQPQVNAYWSAAEAKRRRRPKATSDRKLCGRLDALLNAAMDQYLNADVPLGCFLSGGVDSSLIAAIAARRGGSKLKTFSVGYREAAWDESGYARQVSHHLGTDHHSMILSEAGVLPLLELIPEHFDEPFGDFSQLPTLAVSHLARGAVTVCLSGDGGDELFGGYARYAWARAAWRIIKWIPRPLRRAMLGADKGGRAFPLPLAQRSAEELSGMLPIDEVATFREFYRHILRRGRLSVGCGYGQDGCRVPEWDDADRWSLLEKMQLDDLRHYMGDGILTKVDRASMSVGLEVRTPFLCEAVVDFAFGLPERAKIRGDSLRPLQRRLAYGYVPRALLDRPKMGFGFPVDVWLRGGLRAWADDLLSESALKQLPHVNARLVLALWKRHCSGERDEHWRLWPVLMYAQWHRRWAFALQS